eukprot:101210_1
MSQTAALVDVTKHFHSYYHEIIHSTSTKRLRKFIDALNNKCLKDMVVTYIKSMIEQPNYDNMTPHTFNKKLNETKQNKNKSDSNVLLLLRKYCIKKKKKRKKYL